jgi:hypothetical protein
LSWGQLDKLAVKLKTVDPKSPKSIDEAAFARTALESIPQNDYAYLAVYSATSKDQFAVYTGGRMRPYSPVDLAKWIAEQKAALITPTQTIILLSSANATAAQALANELGAIDKAAKPSRTPRKIISWDEEVLRYQNGSFLGYGNCFEYQLGQSPKQLLDPNIPTGNALVANTPFIILSQGTNILLDWLEDWTPEEEKLKIKKSAIDLKKISKKPKDPKDPKPKKDLYDQFLQNKTCFMGWRYFWALDIGGSNLNADFDFLCDVATIYTRYIQNIQKTDVAAAESALYHASFLKFIKEADEKEKAIKALLVLPKQQRLSTTEFQALVTQAISEKTLVTFFAENGNPTDLMSKQ